MASKMYNRARMTVTSTGTGNLSLGVAVAGYQTFSSSGAQNNDVVSYTIEDGVNWEVGTGTFNSVAGTLSRTVTQSFDGSTYGTSAISVTTNAQVYITALAADIVVNGGPLGTPSSGTMTNMTGLPLATGVTGTLPVANGGTGATTLTGLVKGNGTSAFTAATSGTDYVAPGGALGTPASGTLTNCTGLPAAGVTGLGSLATLSSINNSNWSGTQLSVANGGTGLTSLTAGYIPYGNGTGAFSSSINLFWDAANNRLGVGTNSPTQMLDVNGSVGGNTQASKPAFNAGGLSTHTVGVSNGGGAAFLGQVNGVSNSTVAFTFGYPGTNYMPAEFAYLQTSGAGDTNGAFVWYLRSDTADSQPTEKMRIASDGSVGIGTTSPAYKLDVYSGASADVVRFKSGQSSAVMYFHDSSGNGLKILGSPTYGSQIYTTSSHNLLLGTNNTTQLTLDTAGSLGLGVTPSAWRSGARAFQSGANGYVALWEQASGAANLSFGAYEGSANTFNYRTTGDAPTLYSQLSGAHRWYTAPSGTAGNPITFTQAMTLDAGGVLSLGTTTNSARLYIKAPSGAGCNIKLENSDGSRVWGLVNGVSTATDGLFSIYDYTAGQARVNVDTSGNLLVGTTSGLYSTTPKFNVVSAVHTAWLKNTSGGGYSALAVQRSASYGSFIEFWNQAGNTTIGDISTSTNTSVLYNTSSDISLKENIAPANSSLASILAFPVDQFDWKSDGSHTDYGCVAQKAIDHAPEIVTQGDIWSVDYGRITPRLIKAFQELAAKVSALEAKQ